MMTALILFGGFVMSRESLTIDANIAVKWYVSELDSELAIKLTDRNFDFVAPEHLLAEVGQSFAKRLWESKIDVVQVERALEDIASRFVLIGTEKIFKRAVWIAADIRHSVYDTLYLAVSERWRAPLVTADEKLVARVKGTTWESSVIPLSDIERIL